MNILWFFNRYGEAQIILDSQGKFVDRQGNNLGYIQEGNLIYNYQGRHCGWIDGYVIRDVYGLVVGFSQLSNDYPSPIFPIPQIPPIPAIPQIPFIKPIKQFGWSPFNLVNLFK
ncbi:MAG: hypothetical protein Q7R65_03010 [bacterium]|nr:hypothetical protein [bacterium]